MKQIILIFLEGEIPTLTYPPCGFSIKLPDKDFFELMIEFNENMNGPTKF